MKKRIMAVVLSIAILFSDSASVFACDRKQTETYVSQMLFGDKAGKYKSNEKVQMLMKALYLCSEQYDNDNTKELDALKKKKVSGLPKSEEIEISQKELLECSHNTWNINTMLRKNNRDPEKQFFEIQSVRYLVLDFGIVISKETRKNMRVLRLYYIICIFWRIIWRMIRMRQK